MLAEVRNSPKCMAPIALEMKAFSEQCYKSCKCVSLRRL